VFTIAGTVERKLWSEKFMEWFHKVLREAEIYEMRYPVKGCYIWMPYGMKLRNNIISLIKKLLDETGHQEVLFPTFIPEEFIRKESEHIAKFEDEIFWVVKGGKRELETRLALRPTSETAIMPIFKLWIRAHTDLPLKIYQVVSIFRCETKATHPMIRVREVTTFKEAHTAHATFEEAAKQVEEAISIYRKFFDTLAIPYVISRRPEWDKFPGAVYTIAFDTVLPDGKVLQIGTAHNLGQNFSRAFEVTYLRPDGKHEYVYTTSYGISERVVAAVIAIHGDDRGLVLPPTVAPIQVVIVPIYYKGQEEYVISHCRKVAEYLRSRGFTVALDDRTDKTPGWKFYYWEMRGIPLRLEVGPRDIENKVVTVVRRDTLERRTIAQDMLDVELRKLLNEVYENLKQRAWSWFNEHYHTASNIEEASEKMKLGGIVEVPWCGSEECGLAIEDTLNARVLGEPVDEYRKLRGKLKCINCGKESDKVLRIAKTY